MEKGIYTAAMGVMATAVVILIVFSTQASIERKTSSSYATVITDVKRVWQNTRFVLDKETTSVFLQNCNDSEDPSAEFNNALNEIFNQTGITCTASNLTAAGGAVNLDLECEKKLEVDGEEIFRASYSGSITFEKTVAGPPCTITDVQSGIQEAP